MAWTMYQYKTMSFYVCVFVFVCVYRRERECVWRWEDQVIYISGCMYVMPPHISSLFPIHKHLPPNILPSFQPELQYPIHSAVHRVLLLPVFNPAAWQMQWSRLLFTWSILLRQNECMAGRAVVSWFSDICWMPGNKAQHTGNYLFYCEQVCRIYTTCQLDQTGASNPTSFFHTPVLFFLPPAPPRIDMS